MGGPVSFSFLTPQSAGESAPIRAVRQMEDYTYNFQIKNFGLSIGLKKR
jgi:hypothetical protein